MEMKSLTIGGKTYDEFNPAAAEMDKKLDKTGGMVTGNINMPGKTLLTEQIELKTGNVDGVLMYSESRDETDGTNKPVLSLYGSNADQAVTIFNVETPTKPYEATNKKYVDSLYATPNNAPLTFTGAVEATYDGTEDVVVNIPSGGDAWALVAETTTTQNINVMHVIFAACSAVAIEFYWGGVENDLGDIGIFPNTGSIPYNGEKRAAVANVTSSATKKRGVLCAQIDCRVGSHWYATSWQKDRDDGSFGAIDATKLNNLDIGLKGSAQYSLISNYYMTPKNDVPANGVRSITAYGAGMAIGTTLKVWGIKK